VEDVSWLDVQKFLQAAQKEWPGCALGLPLEAEWEYACRAGSQTAFCFGETISTDQINFDGNYPVGKGKKGEYRERTLPVKDLPANAWGLYQMHGNVWEWCADGMRAYEDKGVADPGWGEVFAELEADGKLPFVLPIVLYNGSSRWNAAVAIEALIHPAPAGFADFVPRLSYFLLDEGSFDEAVLVNQNNLAAMIFLIENQTSVEGLHRALAMVLQLAETGNQASGGRQKALFKAIAQLAQRVWKRNLPDGVPMPEGIADLKGVVSMLAENVEKMVAKSEQQGMQQGSAMMLQAMLASRFGPLPIWAMEKIAAASAEQLASWGVALLTAKTMETVFA
jgi:Sulfatase-modifying factor enzyme 1/Putative transposase, YhgA-like